MKSVPHFGIQVFLAGMALFTTLLPLSTLAQVAINTDGAAADPSAMLDVKSTTGGVLAPRMTSAQRNGITAPATGLLVFDTNTNFFWYFNGTEWVQLDVFGSSGPSVITPPQITATANNYNPTGFDDATIVRISGDNGIRMITGLAAGTDGEEKTLVNVGSHPLYLAPEHNGSIAENRIVYHEEVMIPAGGSCRILYDNTSSRWRPTHPPCPNYTNLQRSVHYDKSAGKVPEGASDDIQLDVFGSLTTTLGLPSATSPFTSWNFNTGSAQSGGLGLFYAKSSEEMAYVSSTHMVGKMRFKTPATLSDASNQYYFFLRLADLPSSGFWDQNNSLGIRYRHTVNGGKWQCYSRSSGGTDTAFDSGISFDVNTEYELMVTLNKTNTEATYFINGVVVGRINSNLPAATGLGVSTHLEKLTGTSARSLLVYRFMGAAIAP